MVFCNENKLLIRPFVEPKKLVKLYEMYSFNRQVDKDSGLIDSWRMKDIRKSICDNKPKLNVIGKNEIDYEDIMGQYNQLLSKYCDEYGIRLNVYDYTTTDPDREFGIGDDPLSIAEDKLSDMVYEQMFYTPTYRTYGILKDSCWNEDIQYNIDNHDCFEQTNMNHKITESAILRYLKVIGFRGSIGIVGDDDESMESLFNMLHGRYYSCGCVPDDPEQMNKYDLIIVYSHSIDYYDFTGVHSALIDAFSGCEYKYGYKGFKVVSGAVKESTIDKNIPFCVTGIDTIEHLYCMELIARVLQYYLRREDLIDSDNHLIDYEDWDFGMILDDYYYCIEEWHFYDWDEESQEWKFNKEHCC